MFLAGGLGKNSPHCIVTLAGSDPAVRPLMLDNQQAQAMLQKQSEDLERDEVTTALICFLASTVWITSHSMNTFILVFTAC